jgi:outer membrane protein insertion porin family
MTTDLKPLTNPLFMHVTRLAALAFLSSLFLSSLPAQTPEVELIQPPSSTGMAPEPSGALVREITIEYAGPRSVAKSVVTSNMRTAVGRPYNKAVVEQDLRTLYGTGLFTNLRIYDEPVADGVRVVVIVEPKPIIREIVISGWSAIKDTRLKQEIKSKVGDTLSEQQVAADITALRNLYQSRGFKDATVNYRVETNNESGRTTITFDIAESGRQFIRNIAFSGNASIPTKTLLKLFKTKKRTALSGLFGTGVVKDEEFQQDLQSLRKYYQDQGYVDVELKGVEYKPAGKKQTDVVITLVEGRQYRVGKFEITGNTVYPTERIRQFVKMSPGAVYSPANETNDVRVIMEMYGEKGYVDVTARPDILPNTAAATMDVTYLITEGGQSSIEKIVIQGNNKTRDKVIRRELAVAPGDVYNSIRVEASRKRLENLNYFEKVEISPQETTAPDRKNMVVDVLEKRTGQFSFGAGFSSIDSLLGFVEVSQANFDLFNWPAFTGAGQRMRLRLQYGVRRQDYVLSFVEPWFMDQRISFGFDLFYRESSYYSSVFDEARFGTAIKFGKSFNPFLSGRAVYRFESIGINNVDPNASEQILLEAGTRTRSAVEIGLTHDTRDNFFLTRTGHKVDGYIELAGGPFLGGTDLWRVGLDASQFYHLGSDVIVQFQGTLQAVDSYGKPGRVPIFDRLFAGGANNLRGFRYRDVGPRDDNGEPIGGRSLAVGTAELTFPIVDRVRGAIFSDAGFVAEGVFSAASPSLDVGIGVRLNLPIGPLRLDYGIPVVTGDAVNSGGQFQLNVGYQF